MANDIGKHFDSSSDTIDTDTLNVGDTLTFASIAQKDYVDALLSARNLKVVLSSAGHYGVWAGSPAAASTSSGSLSRRRRPITSAMRVAGMQSPVIATVLAVA